MYSGVENKLIEKYGILDRDVKTSHLEINETISELSYLTHSHFRYYGKFPSKLASFFLERYLKPDTVFFDNYAGSGTSLVEAKLRGIPSYGVDINPLAVLACNVKTTIHSQSELTDIFEDIKSIVLKTNRLSFDTEGVTPQWTSISKWFNETAIRQLTTLRHTLNFYKFPDTNTRDFFWLGFFGIVRRVSTAHDAEIRPHVNKKKKQRDVFEAYFKKMAEMISNSTDFTNYCKDPKVVSRTFLGSNTDLSQFSEISKAGVNLSLSHPPYLNCFDYLPVYNLEFQWATDLPFIWGDHDLRSIKRLETKSWPATTEKILYGYFDANKKVYEELYKIMQPGGICGIVIGDSTIRKELIRVHKILAAICEDIGFELVEIVYRSTHYGAGKYAYKDRADYHANGAEGKKDGILIFKKVA